jgi:hypothetical protein
MPFINMYNTLIINQLKINANLAYFVLKKLFYTI